MKILVRCVFCLSIFSLAACSTLKISPPSEEKPTLLVLPFKIDNTSQTSRMQFHYIYEIVSMNDAVEPLKVVFNKRFDGDIVLIDSLPPGDYKLARFSYEPVGTGDHTYGDNVEARNDRLHLEAGQVTIFSKSLNIRKYHGTPGRGQSTTYAHSITAVWPPQTAQIMETLASVPNFDKWKLYDGPRATLTATTEADDVTGQSTTSTLPESSQDIVSYHVSGRYRSSITSDSHYIFKRPYREIELTFEQQGNQLTGVDDSGEFMVSGTIKGNKIKYYMEPSLITGYYNVTGEWTVSADQKQLTGRWKDSRGDGPGQWDLTKLE